ncbi:MAG: hypothetical protein NW215_06215 [Hyphomicrobiales bacterium]|nr:hypothetical protein [Hyphomicrobiales bacterium]
MKSHLIATLAACLLTGCGVSQDGPSLGLDSDTAHVIVAADVATKSCKSVMIGLGKRDGAEYKGLRHVLVKGHGFGPAKPMVMNFGPGEYHITQITCAHDDQVTTIGTQYTHFASISFKHSYASFRVGAHALHDIGLIRFHVADDGAVKVERASLLPETIDAVKRQHPEKFEKLVSAPAVIDPDMNSAKMYASTEKARTERIYMYYARPRR